MDAISPALAVSLKQEHIRLGHITYNSAFNILIPFKFIKITDTNTSSTSSSEDLNQYESQQYYSFADHHHMLGAHNALIPALIFLHQWL